MAREIALGILAMALAAAYFDAAASIQVSLLSDEVGAGGVHRHGLFLGANRVGERVVAANPADVDLGVWLHRLHALGVAVRVAVQEGDIERADDADLVRLR